jgi:microcystin-dependent protein
MSQPYIGEIRMFAGNFAIVGWAFCDGSLMAISQNDALFQLIGTTYGGDGVNTFALPDLRGRVPIHMGNGFTMAQSGGAESVTLTGQQIPSHTHTMLATNNNASAKSAAGNVLAQTPTYTPYNSGLGADSTMAASSIGTAGGSQPHQNLQPFLCVNFIISLFGVYPSQT